jgi:hypothetical protein
MGNQTTIPSDIDAVLPFGANSFLDTRLPRGTYCRGWNVVIRGGIPQTRPGTQWFVNFPVGKLQGASVFNPITGFQEIVAVIDGLAYSSQYPYDTVVPLTGITMSPDVDTVFIAPAIQSVVRNPDGSLSLVTPKRVLLFQDGASPPAYYDGYNAAHLTGIDETPLGTAMQWSGNRLWVARKDRVFASDYGNPFSFVEQFYLGGSDSFLMPGVVTAMAEILNLETPVLFVFTETDTIALQSGVYARDTWSSTPYFQKTVFPGIGCVSSRGIALQAGWLYWYSQRGLQSLNSAQASRVSSTLLVSDNEMNFSKGITDHQLHQVALAAHDNYLLVSVPYGGTENRHTWVMDTASVQTLQGAGNVVWASVWTGFEAFQWVSVGDDSHARLFALCTRQKRTSEGTPYRKNSLVEFFREDRSDSGQAIECAIELRVMTGNTPTLKQFTYANITLSEISGVVDLAVDWKGFDRGQYKRCLTKRVLAAEGSFRADEPVTDIFAYRPQFRRVYTKTVGATGSEVPGTSKDLESDQTERNDWGFQFLVSWSGRTALRSFEPVYTSDTEQLTGRCELDETSEVFSNFFGYDGRSVESIQIPIPIFTASASYTGCGHGYCATASATATSNVSLLAAGKVAQQASEAQVDITVRDNAPLVIGL